jgi:hypothetical protein
VSRINPGQQLFIIEDRPNIREVDTVFLDVAETLLLVPFELELHSSTPM